MFQTRPSLPRYQCTWDVNIVLDYIERLTPVEELSLKQLTLKLVMLIALITGQRCQTIHLLNLTQIKVLHSGVQFVVDKLVKQSKPGNVQPVLMLPRFSGNVSLCVVHTLREYLVRTRDFRVDVDSNQLFLSYLKPYKPVSKDTVSRWIKTMMAQAGINTHLFKPHSTRAASSSKACFAGVPLTSVMKAASWSSDCTFTKFYKKPVNDNCDYASGVLGEKERRGRDATI